MPGKWRLSVSAEFSAAHQIENYDGKCENMHGHNFTVSVLVEGQDLDPSTGMLVDFATLKRELRETVDQLDHKHLNAEGPLAGKSPSSEVIAQWIFLEMSRRLSGQPAYLREVTVSEKPGQSATYLERA